MGVDKGKGVEYTKLMLFLASGLEGRRDHEIWLAKVLFSRSRWFPHGIRHAGFLLYITS